MQSKKGGAATNSAQQAPTIERVSGSANAAIPGKEHVNISLNSADQMTKQRQQMMLNEQEPESYISEQTPEQSANSQYYSFGREGAASGAGASTGGMQQTTQNTSEPELSKEQPDDSLQSISQDLSKRAIQTSASGQFLAQTDAVAQLIRTDVAPVAKESSAANKSHEMIQLQVQNLMLFDKPKIKQPADSDTKTAQQAAAQNPQQQQRLRLIFEKDPKNMFLITNPTAIFKFIRQDRFLHLSDDEQLQIVSRLDEILDKCPYNAHLLSEQIVTLNVSRSNQETIEYYRKRTYSAEDKAFADLSKAGSSTQSTLALTCSSQDLVFQLIHIGLRFCGKSSEIKTKISETILLIIGKICQGRRFLRCHFELVYQFVKAQVNKIMAKVKAQGLVSGTGQSSRGKQQQRNSVLLSMEGYQRIDYCTRMLQSIVTRKRDLGPQNYFFFLGYLSGILLNSKPLQTWPFVKGFSTCLWFKIHEHQASLQDPNNLPVLFNCASNGFGGFECYFNQNKLFYRILPPINYQPPTVESNGVQISEFTPGKWYFLGLEHDKPYLARAHLTAIVNDKQVVNFPMDYPRFDNNSKLNMVSICTNMVGQLTTFMLFREQISNPQKFLQMYKHYEFGLGTKDTNLSSLNKEIFDQILMKKLLILYTPHRYHNKIVYDFIDMNDGELLFNCGTWHLHQKPLLADVGGINSLLPLLENIKTLISLESSKSMQKTTYQQQKERQQEGQSPSERSAALVNNFLELALAAIGNHQVDTRSSELSNFIKLLLQTIGTLPVSNPHVVPVDCQTIQLLAEIRFLINDPRLSEEFFLNLMFTSDFWMNTHNIELINEFWSFVKAIYSQNPVLYNNVFPIQNLIDFMIKICDTTKEGAFCCEYHKRTFFMLYAPWQNEGQITSQRSAVSPTHSLQMQVSLDNQSGQPLTKCEGLPSLSVDQQVRSKTTAGNRDLPIYQIDRYLEPIAGVLEYVLTSGGDEILSQIQFIAKSLTVKSCACFHMQMLKLLKVLLLDKSDNDCASPSEFASKFLDVNGLQILLYLCQNASFDVKTMCIKLIDVLSSQTQLIQMRIDTDLVTYLSHVILPEQLVQLQLQNTQMLHHLQMQMVDEKIGAKEGLLLSDPTNQQQTQQQQQITYAAEEDNSQNTSPMKQCQFFAFEEVSKNPDADNNSSQEGENSEAGSPPVGESPQFNVNVQSEMTTNLHNQDEFDSDVPIMKAPQFNKKGGDEDDQDNSSDNDKEEPYRPEASKQDNYLSLDQSPAGTQKKEQKFQVDDDFKEQDELQNKSVSPMVKPTPGKSMFNFGGFIDTTNKISPDKQIGLPPMSPDGEAQPIIQAKRRPNIPSALLLDSQGSSSGEKPYEPSAATVEQNAPRPAAKKMMGLGLTISDDDNSQDGEASYERDSDGQNSPELIIPKQARGPRQQASNRPAFNTFTQPHPPSTRNKPALAFGAGGLGKGKKGLNIQLSDDEEDELDKFMPPTRDQFEKQYGDTILADYDDDEEDDIEDDVQNRQNNIDKQQKDEVAPKPTADVMMSRNLKGGVGKNFNFAFSSGGESDEDSPARKIKDDREADSDDADAPMPQRFGSRPINLLSQKGGTRVGFGRATGVKKGFVVPLITTDEDQLGSLYNINDKDDGEEDFTGPVAKATLEVALDIDADRIDMPMAKKNKKPRSFLQLDSADDSEENESTHVNSNLQSQGPTSAGGEPQGTTGATHDLNVDTPSCSSEQSSAKKTQKSHFTNRKAPSMKLAIDIVSINNQFNYGGEKGELKPEELESKLESDIVELAGKCIAAMRRAKKHKPRTRFNQLLAQEMLGDDDSEEEQEDAQEEQDEDDEDTEQEEAEEQLDENAEQDEVIQEEFGTKENLLSTTEIQVEEQMQIALAVDTLNIREPDDSGLQIDNVSDGAVNGDFLEQQQHNQTQQIDLNVEIMGDRLSYEELFKKNKKRGRSDRNSMANYSSGMSDITLIDGNQTMTKSLRNMFNEPMSVRGIKRIEIEEDEKIARLQDIYKQDSGEALIEEIDELPTTEQIDSNVQSHAGAAPLGKGIQKHKLTLTNIVEEEISPTSKSSASILSKPKSNRVNPTNAVESGDPNRKFDDTQGISTADDKELLEEEALHSGSVERYLLNHSAGQQVAPQTHTGSTKQAQKVHKVRDNMLFADAEENGGIDDYTQELENLYTSCLEWLLNRSPGGLFKNLIIDDYDKITFQPALHILMTLVSYSNNLVRQRALQDLHTLAQLDAQNGQIILQSPKFHSWLLELLMPYQDFNTAQSVLSESSRAVYDMGCKLHTLLLKNACSNPEEVAFKRINLLTRWPTFIYQRFLSRQEEDWFLKQGTGLVHYHCREYETASQVVRVLLTQLINSFREDSRQGSFKLTNPVTKNMIHITMQVEELIFSSHEKIIDLEQQNTGNEAGKKKMQDGLSIINNNADVNESLFRWIQRDYLQYQNGTGSSQILWAEWDLVEALLNQVNPLFHESLFGAELSQNATEIEHSLLQNINGIDYNNDIEILMYEQNVPGNTSTVPQAQATYGFLQNSRFAIVNRMTGHGQPANQNNNPAQSLTHMAEQSQANNANNMNIVEQTFMKALMNIICITIEQTDTNQLTYLWLDRLERFVKHLIIVSEIWKNKNEQYYSQVQKKISESIAFAFAFLFHEVNNTGTPKSTNVFPGQATFGNQNSPQEKVQRSKLFAQSMKNLTIFLSNVVHYSNQMMIHAVKGSQSVASSTFSYFTAGNSKDIPASTPASRLLLQTIFVKQYQGQNTVECLLSLQDIAYLRESNFEDFPERFHQNEWKVAFFHNQVLSTIKYKQINLRTLDQYEQRRKAYSVQVLEQISKNDNAKDEILKRIQEETLDTIGSLSEQEHERKNKDALLIDNFIRERNSEQRSHLKYVLGPKGTWRQKWDPCFQKVSLQDTGEGAHCIMIDKPSNAFLLINEQEVEKNIFEKVHNKENASLDDRILNQGRVDKILQMYQDSGSRSSDLNYPPLTPTSNLPKLSKGLSSNEHIKESIAESLDEERKDDISSDEDSIKNIQSTSLNRFSDPNNGTDKAMTLHGHPKTSIEHFSKPLSLIQKKDLQRLYISYLKEQFFLNRTPARKVIIESPCQILRPLSNCKGFMCMTNYELIFFYEMDTIDGDNQQKSTIFFFEQKVLDTKPYNKVISLSSIKEIQRRHFLTQKTALEIFLINNKQILLNFPDSDMRDQFAKKILRQRKTKCKNLKYYTSLDPKWILRKKDLTEQWQNWKISNFEYLMQLNQLAGRSYNDLSQYPVLPWLFSTYNSKDLPDLSALQPQPRGGAPPGQFRDMTKNMQLLGTAQRQAEFQRKYEDAESFIGLDDRFHCGSHFSNPGIVLHYLSRIAPYVEANVELHGRTLDHPERVFYSLDQSFNNALTDFADVRELTPEFFFLPEIFINHNKCNFGVKQDGTKVNNVQLPAWADQNAFKFVQVMREGIESQYVSNNLHTWIDYIFGCKQRDQEAIMSLNTFSKITYTPEKEGDFDVSLVNDPILKAAYESQGYNYGQTPNQLFKMNESHPPKKPQTEALKSNLVVDIVARLKVFKPVPNQDALQRAKGSKLNSNQMHISKEAILYAKFVGEQKIVGATKEGFVQHFVWLPRAHDLNPTTPFSLGGDRKLKFNSVGIEFGIDQIDRSIKKFDQPILILNEGKNVIRGGYWDGRVVFSEVDSPSDRNFELRAHQTSVSAMAIDTREQVLITGSKGGEVIVWKNSDFECSLDTSANNSTENINKNEAGRSAATQWFIFKQMNDHDRQVSSIFINNDMCLFVTGSFDGTVNLYNLHSCKFLRTFSHPTLAPIYSAVLAQNPLAICAFFSREDHLWNSFSINGQLLTDLSKITTRQEKTTNQRVLTEDCSHVISPQVIKDSYHMDKLVYGTEKGYIVLRMLPSMLRFRRLQVSNDFPVLTVLVSPDRRFLHVGCGDGGLIVIQAK